MKKLEDYLINNNSTINDKVLQIVCENLKFACENDDEENVNRILLFLERYGEALWSQLLDEEQFKIGTYS